jgi:hypothetical protein
MEKMFIRLSGRSHYRWEGNLRARLEGSVFILCLWLLCMLSSFAIILGYQVRQKLALIQKLEERAVLRYLCEAGADMVIVEVRALRDKSYYAADDGLSNNPAIFKDIAIGRGAVSIYSGYVAEGDGLSRLNYGIVDEERKININIASPLVMERLFRILLADDSAAHDLACAIVDWRDEDSQLTDSGSAEDMYYRGLQYPYEAKDSKFESLRELLLVKGVDENTFEKLKNCITIYGDGRVNINTASRQVLLALGLDEALSGKILNYRLGPDGIDGTSDDNYFSSDYGISSQLSGAINLNQAEQEAIETAAQEYLTVYSNNFMAECVAALNNRKESFRLACVVSREGKVIYWQEY